MRFPFTGMGSGEYVIVLARDKAGEAEKGELFAKMRSRGVTGADAIEKDIATTCKQQYRTLHDKNNTHVYKMQRHDYTDNS